MKSNLNRIIDAAKRVDAWLVVLARERATQDGVDYKIRLSGEALDLHLALLDYAGVNKSAGDKDCNL